MLGRAFLCVLVVAVCTAQFTDSNGIGNTVINALSKPSNPPPMTNTGGWGTPVYDGAPCDPNLGILYNQDPNGPSKDHPLSAYYTAEYDPKPMDPPTLASPGGAARSLFALGVVLAGRRL